MYRSFVSLGRYTPKCFILFVATLCVGNPTDSLLLWSLQHSRIKSVPRRVPGRFLPGSDPDATSVSPDLWCSPG